MTTAIADRRESPWGGGLMVFSTSGWTTPGMEIHPVQSLSKFSSSYISGVLSDVENRRKPAGVHGVGTQNFEFYPYTG